MLHGLPFAGSRKVYPCKCGEAFAGKVLDGMAGLV
jgi:hypothetical protein